MPYSAKVFQVFIASPSDVKEERKIAREVVYNWNAAHSSVKGIVLQPIGWETHSYSESGDHPQNILNRQILDASDMLIAIFWTHLGTPTEVSPSGTVEEIERHVQAGKPAMLYFSERPIVPGEFDNEQYAKLKEVIKALQTRNLYNRFEDISDFRQKLQSELDRRMEKDQRFSPEKPQVHMTDLRGALVVDAHRDDYFNTLTKAIQAARPHDRILVKPGLYKEGVVIDKPIEIIGNGSVNEIVIETTEKEVILFNATRGRIANLTLRQAGGGEFHCIDIAQGRLEMDECDITSQGAAGVSIHGGAAPQLRRNIIHDCKQGGVFIYENGQGVLEDNDIFGNQLAGVAIKTGGNPTLRANRIHHGKRDGVFVWENGRGVLEDNDIFDNDLPGVAIGKGSNLTMRRNRIHHGKREGVYVQENGQGALENNQIFANGLAGVEIRTGGNATLRHNRVSENRSAGIRIYDGGGGVFENNNLRGNEGGAWDVSQDSQAKVKRFGNQE